MRRQILLQKCVKAAFNLLEDFNANEEDIFQPTIGSKSLHKNANAERVSVVNSAKSRNLFIRSSVLPLRKIYKCSWTFTS
jgi:hypothetical protein